MDRTCAALTMVTPLLRSCEHYGLTNTVKQRRSRINTKLMVLAINAQRDRDGALNVPSRTSRSRGALSGSAIRKRRYVRSNHACCHTTSRGQKKFTASRIWRTRLRIVVGHRASTGEKTFVEVSPILQCVGQYRRTILNLLGEHLMNETTILFRQVASG